MKIIVIGSLNIDTTYKLPHIPKEGETILATQKSVQRGGKGQNQAIQMARLGADVTMIGAVGNDEFGHSLIEGLKVENIDPAHMIEKVGSTGTASIYLDQAGKNNIVVFPGANFMIDEKDIEARADIIKSADIIVLQNEIPKNIIEKVLEMTEGTDVISVYNPAPAIRDFDSDYLKYVDYYMPNETELEIITGKTLDENNLEELAQDCLNMGVKNLIVTLGEKGSIYLNGEKTYKQDAKKVKVLDTTGAGDSYIGGFVAALARGESVEEAMEYGTRSSALAVTKLGAVDGMPTDREVDEHEF